VLAVKVNNSQQPNSRWYSGSGIYRNVRLVTTETIHVDHWGTYITTPEVSVESATVSIRTKVKNSTEQGQAVKVKTVILNEEGNKVAEVESGNVIAENSLSEVSQEVTVKNPHLWTLENPWLYKAVTTIECNGTECDNYETTFGIRTFDFDVDKGFSLNGKHAKINGVCDHHDLGCLGS